MVRLICEIVATARESADAVYAALDRALRQYGESIDAFTIWELVGDRFTCIFTSGARYDHYHRASVSALRERCPLAEARRCGSAQIGGGRLAPLHPADQAAVAIALRDLPLVVYIALSAPPGKAQLASISDLCAIAAAALCVARDRAEDRARATYDGLTGLLGPRAFRSALAEQIRVAPQVRIAPRLVLAFIDTDRFKEWNDRFGHAAGDDLLRKLAGMLRAHACGPEDIVARNGGDEFCLVWFDCEKSSGIQRAEKLRSEIASAFASEAIRITASIGVAAFPIDSSSPEGLLEAADAAMYEAKRAGRNRVWFAGGRIVVHGAQSDVVVPQPRPRKSRSDGGSELLQSA